MSQRSDLVADNCFVCFFNIQDLRRINGERTAPDRRVHRVWESLEEFLRKF